MSLEPVGRSALRETMLRSLLAALATACVCADRASAQRTWTVDWYGNGDFTDVPPAVAAAAPGDTIVVGNPDQNRYTTPTIDKGLTVMQSYNWLVDLDLRIVGVPAGQRCQLVGWGGTFDLEIRDCAGAVHLDRCDMFTPFLRTRQSLVISDCALVTVNASGFDDVQITRSSVVITRSGLFGFASFDGTVATPGLAMIDSHVQLADCVVQAASLGITSSTAVPRGGIEMSGGTLDVTGRAGQAFVQGGAACCDFSFNPPRTRVGAAVESSAGAVNVDPDVTLAPQAGAAFAGNSTRTNHERSFLRQVIFPSPAYPSLETDLYASPGAAAVVCVSIPTPPLPSPFGEFWLGAGVLVVASGTTDAAGRLFHSFAGLNANIVTGTTFVWQGIHLAGGELGFTMPAVTVMWLR